MQFITESKSSSAYSGEHMITTSKAPFAKQIPIQARTFMAALVLLASGGSAAAEPIDAAAVIRLAKERDPQVLIETAEVGLAEADVVSAGLYPNPTLSWNREHFPSGANAESEDELAVSIPIEVSGRRSARRALARARVAHGQANLARIQSEAVQRALDAYYRAIAADARADIAADAVARLTEASRVLARREQEGVASGYERTRVDIETELAQSRLRQLQSEAQAHLHTVALLLGLEPGTIELGGDLAVSAELVTGADVAGRRSQSLEQQAIAHAREAQDEAGWAWVPDLSVTGGVRLGMADDTRYGYVAGLALSIPLFSRGQDLRARARASRNMAQARLAGETRQAMLHAASARARLELATSELARFEQATTERIELLVRAADSGYREGQRSIVELIDAQRARAEIAERRLELMSAAKHAEVALRAARGEYQ